ncbi:MAG: D-alanyl-D-alanine carboxypeptidase, partial [Paracoccaceae bacterium]
AGVATRTWISPEASGFMADLLDWPMDIPGNADQFAQLGTKGGSVPGVLTEATYLVAMEGDHAGEIRVGALFLNRLSGSAWLSLQESFVQQGLLVSMLTDDDTVDRVVRALD